MCKNIPPKGDDKLSANISLSAGFGEQSSPLSTCFLALASLIFHPFHLSFSLSRILDDAAQQRLSILWPDSLAFALLIA